MEWFLENWYMVIIAIVVVCVAAVWAYKFFTLPTDEQIKKVKEWLLFAVTQAETDLGSGTGQLKLRTVYDMFVQRFPALVALISFERFSELVDEALVEMKSMLEKNPAVNKLVKGE